MEQGRVSDTTKERTTSSKQRLVTLPFSLTGWAWLQADFPLSEEEWDQMMAVLIAMKPGLVAPTEPAQSDSDKP